MSFLNKINWKNYESYFKDMGVNDAKGGNEALKETENKELLKELIKFFSFSRNSWNSSSDITSSRIEICPFKYPKSNPP